MRNRALFLDRDGVINVDTGYPHRIEDMVLTAGIAEFMSLAKSAGLTIIVVTNQSGIGRGLYSEEQFHDVMAWMNSELQRKGASWDAYYFCPHVPAQSSTKRVSGCECRKPAPGMILRAAREHSLDLKRSLLVGDSASDILAGERAGVGENHLLSEGFDFQSLSRVISSPR